MDDAEYLAWRAEIDLCEDTAVLTEIQAKLAVLAADAVYYVTPRYVEVLINLTHVRMDALRWTSYRWPSLPAGWPSLTKGPNG